MTHTIAFNTGREYSRNGQRIAARKVDQGIILVDVDRHIDCMLSVDTDLTQAAVMWDYDHNVNVWPNDVDLPYDEYYDIVNELRAIAEAI